MWSQRILLIFSILTNRDNLDEFKNKNRSDFGKGQHEKNFLNLG